MFGNTAWTNFCQGNTEIRIAERMRHGEWREFIEVVYDGQAYIFSNKDEFVPIHRLSFFDRERFDEQIGYGRTKRYPPGAIEYRRYHEFKEIMEAHLGEEIFIPKEHVSPPRVCDVCKQLTGHSWECENCSHQHTYDE